MIKSRKVDQIMFVRFDDTEIDGVLSIDGYIDAALLEPRQLADYVLTRLGSM